MRRTPVLFASSIVLLLVLVAAGAAWKRWFMAPPVERLPIPEQLVPMGSAPGQALLAGSAYAADYRSLAPHFVGQARRGFCGVATGVVVINALRDKQERFDQATFFTDAARRVKTPTQVSLRGMSLRELGALLESHGAQATVVQASDTDLNSFRRLARQNVGTAGDYLVVNYQRAGLGQAEGGHISPLAAYDPASDRFLILDVAPHRYPPVWVTATSLWNAMNAPLNPETTVTRGFLVVEAPAAAARTAAALQPAR